METPKLNIPTAKQAKEARERAQYEKARKQIEAVEKLVKEAIANGGTGATYDGYLDGPVVAAIEALGYKVEQGSHRNEDYCYIKW